jgi:hypothetical protein
MDFAPHQITSLFCPNDGNWNELFREVRETKGLLDVVVRMVVTDGVGPIRLENHSLSQCQNKVIAKSQIWVDSCRTQAGVRAEEAWNVLMSRIVLTCL